jgi:pimeloyl-ACP methyl ester carboxylesterase
MKWFWRVLIAVVVIVAILAVLPYFIPVSDRGDDPQSLVTDPDGGFITLQDISVYYEDKGDPADPAILMLHGLFGSTDVWRNNVDALVDAGYRVVTFDRPAFGLSTKTDDWDYSLPNQADLTAELLDALDIGQAIVVGHSAGANVAAHFALLHPERVDRLVLVDAAVGYGGAPGFIGPFLSLPPVQRWGRVLLQAAFNYDLLVSTTRDTYMDPEKVTDEDVLVYWRAFRTAGWDKGLLALTRDSGGSTLSDERIGEISPRTLIIWGDQDDITPLAVGEKLDALIPDSTLLLIEGGGHQPFEEFPDAFNPLLLDWLAATASAGEPASGG